MDGKQFDRLVMQLSTVGSRRGLARWLGAFPIAGAMTALLRDGEPSAAGRRKRHKLPRKHHKLTGDGKSRHKHKKKHKGQHHHQGCTAEPPAQTCAGKCGSVKNTCQQPVDCGSCACDPPCPACTICDAPSQTCVVDPHTIGQSCGPSGQVCQSDGACRCVPEDPCPADACGTLANNCGDDVACGSCDGTTPICRQHVCIACAGDAPCPNGCCAADGSCQNGTSDAACGAVGQPCEVCTGQARCQNQHCVCQPACDGKLCGPDGCGTQCGTGCPAHASCTGDGTACTCDFATCNSTCCEQNAICHATTGECCLPDSDAQTCHNQCGDVVNNCGVSVDCGPCTCGGGCPVCQVCNSDNGECVPDQEMAGLSCGDGQVCQANGTCACNGQSCGACRTCGGNGACAACAHCCDRNGVCQRGTDDTVCGTSGTCVDCGAGRRCFNGQCVCDGTSCPNGCCDAQEQCQDSTDLHCGTAGAPCKACNPCTELCFPEGCTDLGPTCDCANLNSCSGHGCCTPFCTCICEAPWIGPACDQLPPIVCADFATCEECQDHALDGCVYCSETLEGQEGNVCVSADQCLSPVEICS